MNENWSKIMEFEYVRRILISYKQLTAKLLWVSRIHEFIFDILGSGPNEKIRKHHKISGKSYNSTLFL